MLEPYELEIRGRINAAGFLRRSRDDDALWISDLPRRLSDAKALDTLANGLTDIGVACRLEEASRLWKLDLTGDRYAALAATLPRTPPPFPTDSKLHDAYALCRLLLGRPSPIESQPLYPLRAVLKRIDVNSTQMLALIPSLHEGCAELIKRKKPLPSAVGGLLALWITGKELKK